MSTPGREELDEPGRGRVSDGGLQAVAAQDHQRVLLRVEPACASQGAGHQAEDRRRRSQPEHRRHPRTNTPRTGSQRTAESEPETSLNSRGDMRAERTKLGEQPTEASLRAYTGTPAHAQSMWVSV